VIETTELRWFIEGLLPAEVAAWFTNGGTRGAGEHRRDRYLIDGRPDVGVKFRAQQTLELKVRQSVVAGGATTAGPDGLIEVWHKWSPADEFVGGDHVGRWIEVDKRIERRRFSPTGDEAVLTGGERSMAGAGCDVELVDIRVGPIEAWSFAFAAFGPVGNQRNSISVSWRALTALGGPPETMWSRFDRSCGYPEWLEHTVPGSSPT
jgi:hypothetical protein